MLDTRVLYAGKTAWDMPRELWLAPNGEDDPGLNGCPCFQIRLPSFEADGHCWRVGCTPGGGCCVHVRGDQTDADQLKRLLDAMDWYGEWQLHIGADCRDLEGG